MPPSPPPSPEAEPYGAALAVLRTARGMSQKELARVAGLKPPSVSKLERDPHRLKRRRCEELAIKMGYPRSAVDKALAVEVARCVPGDAGWRSRVEGRAGAHLANAWRVAGKLPVADAEFARALRLWEAGAASDPGLLDPVRMLDLEASLRKAQRRLPQGLDLLDRALMTRPAPEVEGRLLINKACVLEKLERYREALDVLERAAPLADAA